MPDMLTELPKAAKDEVTFVSKFAALKLVRRPRQKSYGEGGQILRDVPPLRYAFRNHVLHVRPGRDLDTDLEHTLASGEETGVERDAVQWLKAHPQFNKLFWIDGEEPNKPRPFDHEVLAAMNDAVVHLDVDKLRGLLEAERSTHNRALLVGALTSAVESISRAAEEVAAQEAVQVHGDGQNALEWSEGDSVEDLQRVADALELQVKGSGADGNVLKGDLVKALRKETKKAQEQK